MNVRFANPDDFAQCNAFYNRIYGRSRTLEQWTWEFNHQIDGQIPFAVVEVDGEILGTQAFIPIRMIDAQGVYLTVKSEETLLDVSMRGKDLFAKMYDLLLELADSARVATIWGFTPATKAFVKVGFDVPGNTSQLFFPFSAKAVALLQESSASDQPKTFNGQFRNMGMVVGGAVASVVCAARLALSGVEREVRVSRLEAPPPGAGDLCTAFVSQWGGTTIFRDESYMGWRFFENPFIKASILGAYRDDRLVGWIAYAIDAKSMGYIVDIVAADRDRDASQGVVKALLREATQAIRRTGALGIRGWHVSDHPFSQMVNTVARQLGFLYFKSGNPMVIKYLSAAEDHPSCRDFHQWYITRAFTEGAMG